MQRSELREAQAPKEPSCNVQPAAKQNHYHACVRHNTHARTTMTVQPSQTAGPRCCDNKRSRGAQRPGASSAAKHDASISTPLPNQREKAPPRRTHAHTYPQFATRPPSVIRSSHDASNTRTLAVPSRVLTSSVHSLRRGTTSRAARHVGKLSPPTKEM